MAEYKGIKGFKVQYLSADPSDPIIGQTWYNSTSKDLKYTGVLLLVLGQLVIIWVQQDIELAGAGTQTAGLAFGGLMLGRHQLIQEQQKNTMVTTWTSAPNPLNTARDANF
jgi:hypothetical protein